MADDQDELTALVDALQQGFAVDADLFQRLFPPDFAHRTLTRVEQIRAMLAERQSEQTLDTQVDGVDTFIEPPAPLDLPFFIDDDPDELAPVAPPPVASSPPPPMHTPLGQDMRYGLRGMLGEGGVAQVYLAFDRRLGRPVALKALRPEIGHTRRGRTRFAAESRITARLAHPGIIPVHDAGKLADGRFFFTMQKVEGRTLREVVDALKKGDPETTAQFSLPRLASIFQRVCLTVAYAHDQKVIHRDLKPENILIGAYGEVYVADWGLSRPLDEAAEEDERLTREGEAIGTLYYMAPEQACGELDDQGPGIDIWALGVMLFELLTLDRPFVGRSIINLVYVIATEPPRSAESVAPDRSLPGPLLEIIDDALIKEVEDRSMTAREMAERVAGWLDGIESARRGQDRAGGLLERARKAHDEATAQRERVESEAAAVRRASRALPADASEAQRLGLWRRTRALSMKRVEAEQSLVNAIQFALRAVEAGDDDDAHQLVATAYWQRAMALRDGGDAITAMHFEALARRHDRGALADDMAPTGRLEVARPGDAEMGILTQVPMGPLRMDTRHNSRTGHLPVGSYVIEVESPRCMPARVPMLIEGNRAHRVRITPPKRFEGSRGYVFVQGGPARLGGDPDAPESLPATEHRLNSFLIGRRPVTIAEYIQFLDALAVNHPDAAHAHVPRGADGSHAFAFDRSTGRFSVPATPLNGWPWQGDWPVTRVGLDDAMAYCAWRGGQEDATIRLPNELEWEYAARGVDRRRFPWGDGFDASLCRMAETDSGRQRIVPVGSHLRDRSPFGVEDLAGLVGEWTSSRAEAMHFIVRGGGFDQPASACRAAARRSLPGAERTLGVGFRVVRVLPGVPGLGEPVVSTGPMPRM